MDEGDPQDGTQERGSPHDPEIDPQEDGGGPRPTPPVMGPVVGAMIGIVAFIALGDRFSLPIRLGVCLVVIAAIAYVSLLMARRRR